MTTDELRKAAIYWYEKTTGRRAHDIDGCYHDEFIGWLAERAHKAKDELSHLRVQAVSQLEEIVKELKK